MKFDMIEYQKLELALHEAAVEYAEDGGWAESELLKAAEKYGKFVTKHWKVGDDAKSSKD